MRLIEFTRLGSRGNGRHSCEGSTAALGVGRRGRWDSYTRSDVEVLKLWGPMIGGSPVDRRSEGLK